jgi:prophage regulatory protein
MKIEIEHEGSCLSASGRTGRLIAENAMKRNAPTSNVLPPAGLPLRILRLPAVCFVTGLGRSMIYQMEAELRFPMRVRIGTRAVGWLEGEVRAWLEKRIELSRATVLRRTVALRRSRTGPNGR